MLSCTLVSHSYTYGAHMGREYDRLMDKVVKKDSYWLEKVRALGEPRVLLGPLTQELGLCDAVVHTCSQYYHCSWLRHRYSAPGVFNTAISA